MQLLAVAVDLYFRCAKKYKIILRKQKNSGNSDEKSARRKVPLSGTGFFQMNYSRILMDSMTGWSAAETVPLPSCTGVFSQMASTISMPAVTWPKAAYCPSRCGASSCMMKNCELALS